MDYGVFLPVSGAAATRDGLTHAARTAERLGFTTVWAADRIIIPRQIDTSYSESRGAQRRAGLHCDAWFPYFPRMTPAELSKRFDYVRAAVRDAGRDPDQIHLNACLPAEITSRPTDPEPDRLCGTPEQVAGAIAAFERVGVEHLALQFLVGRYPERLDQMERLMPVLVG
jgi:alkanesulfonate monooxygenase SsuD/methylene tetrahydromethanopterin reductase-like flavin-dependent oxidoreductase (luciferase family)